MHHRRLFRLSLLASAVPALVAMPAAAQTAEAEAEAPAEDIVVTGIRSSLNSALQVKRSAASVVDAISAEDIGHYPDINVAESVQRISGVQINRTRGEGQTVNIRGLPATFTLATLNGRNTANALVNADATATRAFDFTILAPEFVRTLEVYKSPTADLMEGGLSGTVNIRTPRAFEIGKRVLTGSVQGEYSDNSGKLGPRASALYSDVFANGRLGITIGGSYSRREPETHSMTNSYVYQTEGVGLAGVPSDLNGNGVIEPALGVRIPSATYYMITKEARERYAGIGSIEFRATDNLKLYVEGLYSKLTVKAVRNDALSYWTNSRGLVSSGTEAPTLDGYPTETSLQLTGLDQRGNGRFEDRSGDLYSITGGAAWDAGPWQVTAEGTYSNSKQTSSNLAIATFANGAGVYGAEPGDELPSVGFLGTYASAVLDPASYKVASINGQYLSQSRDKVREGKLDAARDLDGWLTKLAFGVRYAERAQYQDNPQLTIMPAGVSALYGGLPAGPTAGSYSAAPFMHLVSAGKGGFLDSYSGSASFPTSYLVSDTRGFISQFSSAQLQAAGTYSNDASNTIDVHEKTFAGYGRAEFAFGALSGNLGLRVVHTWQQSVGVSPDLTGITFYPDAGGVTRVPSAAAVKVSREYIDFLPSLNLKFDVSPSLLLRFAASRTMARPNLSDISPSVTVNGFSQTVTQKNPYLDPFRANNLDATAEWYFAKGGVLGVSAFYKDIVSLIRSEITVESLPVRIIRASGATSTSNLNFNVNRIVNGGGVTVKGFEVFYQQSFTFLPAPLDGFGASANYTFIDNSDPEQLTAASRNNFNVTGYYEKGPVGIRLSYAWRGGFLLSPAQAQAMGTRSLAYGTLDGSASLKITDNASLTLEAVNLLNEAQLTQFTTGLPSAYVDAGRRILFGARFTF